MDLILRIKAVKAMEFMVRNINCEYLIELWLQDGIADGDIEYGDLSVKSEDYENLDYWLEDDHFAELMALYLRIMKCTQTDGGLYCDGVVSK